MSRWERGGRALAWLACGLSWLAALGVDAPLIRGYFPASGFRLAPDLACFRDNGAWLGRDLATAAQSAAQVCTYKYPPPFLFLATPLSWLTPEQDFAVWSAASVAVLVLAAWALGLPSAGRVIGGSGTPHPAVPKHRGERNDPLRLAALGRLAAWALGWAETAPLAAGIAAGAMIVKPEFGILLPVCGRGCLGALPARGHRGNARDAGRALAGARPAYHGHTLQFRAFPGRRIRLGECCAVCGDAAGSRGGLEIMARTASPVAPADDVVPRGARHAFCLSLRPLGPDLGPGGGRRRGVRLVLDLLSLYLFVSVFSVSPGAPGLALLLWMLWRSRKSNQQSLTAMTRLPHALEPAQARESERLLFVNKK